MFSMFRFLMGDKSVVYRIIRLLILILTIYVSYDLRMYASNPGCCIIMFFSMSDKVYFPEIT